MTLTNDVAELSDVIILTLADVMLDTNGRDYSYKDHAGLEFCCHFKHRVAILTVNSDRQLWSHYSTGSKTDFSNGPDQTGEQKKCFYPIGVSAIWDQHSCLLSPSRDG